MNNEELRRRFATLTTAHVADACIRAEVPVRCAPSALQAVIADGRLVGRVIPARHVGSVDIFLEALGDAAAGSVLVVDNGGRLDESCVGDLMALEVQGARLAGIVIWGLHRDTERRQAERIRGGDSLRSQVKFDEYLAARAKNPDLGFREHLRGVGAAIEV